MQPRLHALDWAAFLDTWSLRPAWLIALIVVAASYLGLRVAGRLRSSVRAWRVAAFLAGVALLWTCLASGIAAYSMAVFWMHMVLHLLLIMVVPALLVLGHPITTCLEAMPVPTRAAARRVLDSRGMLMLLHPLTGLLVYGTVIVGTHLTGFMDQMAEHGWLMAGEEVLYVVAGWLFLTPLLGEEPRRRPVPYLARLLVLLVAMVPDTIVGIVLLQTDHDLFPVMMANHPAWAPAPTADINIAGGLMWAGGDGLMMLIAVGLMLSVITSPVRRTQMTGAWVEGVRRSALGDGAVTEQLDPDSDEALAAYNEWLSRLNSGGHD